MSVGVQSDPIAATEMALRPARWSGTAICALMRTGQRQHVWRRGRRRLHQPSRPTRSPTLACNWPFLRC